MLNLAKNKLKKEKFKCNFKFLKLDKNIAIKSNSVNIITINSVLHHIPDTGYFINEIDRILKREGLVIIGHKPNIRFAKNKRLIYMNHLLSLIFAPKEELKFISVKLGIFDILDEFSEFISSKRKK